MEDKSDQTKNANNKVDILYNIWLGRRDVFQLFDDGEKVENIEHTIRLIRQLLDEDM